MDKYIKFIKTKSKSVFGFLLTLGVVIVALGDFTTALDSISKLTKKIFNPSDKDNISIKIIISNQRNKEVLISKLVNYTISNHGNKITQNYNGRMLLIPDRALDRKEPYKIPSKTQKVYFVNVPQSLVSSALLDQGSGNLNINLSIAGENELFSKTVPLVRDLLKIQNLEYSILNNANNSTKNNPSLFERKDSMQDNVEFDSLRFSEYRRIKERHFNSKVILAKFIHYQEAIIIALDDTIYFLDMDLATINKVDIDDESNHLPNRRKSIKFSRPNTKGTHIAYSIYDKVKILNIPTMRISEVPLLRGCVKALSLNENADKLAIATDIPSIIIYDTKLKTSKEYDFFNIKLDSNNSNEKWDIRNLSCSPDGNHIAITSNNIDKKVIVYNLEKNYIQKSITAKCRMKLAHFSPNGKYLGVIGCKKYAKVYSWPKFEEYQLETSKPTCFFDIEFYSKSKVVVTGSSDPIININDTESGKPLALFHLDNDKINVTTLSFSSNLDRAIIGTRKSVMIYGT